MKGFVVFVNRSLKNHTFHSRVIRRTRNSSSSCWSSSNS